MIRPATVADAGAIGSMELECFGREAWSNTLVLDEVESDRTSVLVSEIAGLIDGYGSISVMDEVADLHRIAVLPASRRHGTARVLLAALADRARGLGATRMLLEVADDNAAATSLYRSSRFVTISRRRRYFPSGSDCLVMQASLMPILLDGAGVQGLRHD